MSLLLLFRASKKVPTYVTPASYGGGGGRGKAIKDEWLKPLNIKRDDDELLHLMAFVIPIITE